MSMPRSFVLRILIGVIVVVVALVALSRVDPSKTTRHVEKAVPENALAK